MSHPSLSVQAETEGEGGMITFFSSPSFSPLLRGTSGDEVASVAAAALPPPSSSASAAAASSPFPLSSSQHDLLFPHHLQEDSPRSYITAVTHLTHATEDEEGREEMMSMLPAAPTSSAASAASASEEMPPPPAGHKRRRSSASAAPAAAVPVSGGLLVQLLPESNGIVSLQHNGGEAPLMPKYGELSPAKPHFRLHIAQQGAELQQQQQTEEEQEEEEEKDEDSDGVTPQLDPANTIAVRKPKRQRKLTQKMIDATTKKEDPSKPAPTSAPSSTPAPAPSSSPSLPLTPAQKRSETLRKKREESKQTKQAYREIFKAEKSTSKEVKTPRSSRSMKKEQKEQASPASKTASSKKEKQHRQRPAATAEPAATSQPPSRQSSRKKKAAESKQGDDASMENGVQNSPPASSSPSFSFPPLSTPPSFSSFEHSFADFMAQADPSLDASLFTSAPPIPHTKAPSSQLLHATRVQLYRELCEEYFGRYMKDTPDPQGGHHKGEESAKASSASHPPKPRRGRPSHHTKVDARSPEQLRMLFCDTFNRCEADRVPSTACHIARIDFVGVPPIDHADKLKSFSATDAASLGRKRAPQTLEEHRAQQRLARLKALAHPPSPPLPLNPHFDLFQYAPFIESDEYEPIVDELALKLSLDEEDHPILPAYSGKGKQAVEETTNGAEEQQEKNGTETKVEDVEMKESTADDVNTVQTAEAAAAAATSSDAVAPSAANGSAAPTAMDTSPDTASTEQEEQKATEQPFDIKQEAATDESLPVSSHEGINSPSSSMDATVVTSPEPPNSAAAAAASTSEAATAAASSAAAAASAVPAAPSTSSSTLSASSLPQSSYGVGLFGSLDFNSASTHGKHWADSCFAWHFDNQSRMFHAYAYSSLNAKSNDVKTVTDILAGAQARFHHDMVQDEEEELLLKEWRQGRRERRRVHKKSEGGAQTEEKEAEAEEDAQDGLTSSGLLSSGPYSPGSPQYDALKQRIRHSFEQSIAAPLFLPHTYLREVSPTLHKRASTMAQECVKVLQEKFTLPQEEHFVDDLFGLVVPGFGCQGVQVFLKIGLCVTLLHDEIGWCSALNYMSVRSRGCALWIGLNFHKASVKMSKEQLRTLINATTFNLSDFLTKLRKMGLQPSMQLQTPGTTIYSPTGRGAAHIVVTVGSWVEQVAINHGLSAEGIRQANTFWDGVEPLLHNSALATRCVVPLMWLQKKKGWDVGLQSQMELLDKLAAAVEQEGKYKLHYRDYTNPSDQETYCRYCFNHKLNRRAILYVSIDGCCPACFVDRHEGYLHFANMIDRRFK